MPPVFLCFGCQHELSALTFLRGVTDWWPRLDAAQHICPVCGHREELRLVQGKIELGYVYAAGTAHFAGMKTVELPGLEIVPGEHGLTMRCEGQVWTVPTSD